MRSCIQCKRELDSDLARCTSCLEKRRKAQQKRRANQRASGQCIECKRRVAKGRDKCQSCLDAATQRYSNLASAGACVICTKVNDAKTGKRCIVCRAKFNESKKLCRQAWKIKVMEHYGGKCKCCGDEFIWRLTIDHINGGGATHRKLIGSGGIVMYRWLILNDYPSGYQVLCFSCNSAKYYGHGCPH